MSTPLLLTPMSSDKDDLLWSYTEQWRKTYATAARLANYIEGPKFLKKLAYQWHRAHERHCDHLPHCRSFYDYVQQVRDPIMANAKQKASHKLPEPHINYRAFSHAWFKGFSNRRSHPNAYIQMSIIPKGLARIDNGLLILRPFPYTELAFYLEGGYTIPDDGKALILYYRDPHRKKAPTRRWYLRV